MKVILEKSDIISLLGKAMGRTLNSDDVEIHLEPFEVVIHDASNVLITDETAQFVPSTPKAARLPGIDPADNAIEESMESLAAANRALAAQSPRVGRKAAEEKRPRTKMVGEYDEPRNPLEGDDE